MRRQKKNVLKAYSWVLLVQVVILIVMLANVENLSVENGLDETEKMTVLYTDEDDKGSGKEQSQEEATTADNTLYEVSLIAVGDNLISDSVTHCGLQEDGSYEFSELFEELKEDIEAADLAVINQETILGGSDFEYTGYPNFNSPYEIGDAIIDAGFDIVLHATNHSYDMGLEGAKNCLNYWNNHPEIAMVGMNQSAEEQNSIKIVEKNNISIAILNYTYGMNGYKLPEGKEYLVNLIDKKKIASDIKRAEEMADFTIVFPHWGVEYVHEPNEEQRELANMMVEKGADLIIGTHPHVLETIEWITSENGNQALCYYSIGNYTSSQDKTATMLGGMAKLTIRKKGSQVYIKDGAGVVPIVTHYIWGSGRLTKTYKLTEYDKELASAHSINTVTDDFSVDKLNKIAEEVVGKWIVE